MADTDFDTSTEGGDATAPAQLLPVQNYYDSRWSAPDFPLRPFQAQTIEQSLAGARAITDLLILDNERLDETGDHNPIISRNIRFGLLYGLSQLLDAAAIPINAEGDRRQSEGQ
jgi:hypothetical protein